MKTGSRPTRRFAIKQACIMGGAGLAIACRAVPDVPPVAITSAAFRVPVGEARSGSSFKMKGVTSNTLDLKIGGGDTGGRVALFEQRGESPNGGPPLHIHLEQDEFFFVLEGEYQFEVGGERVAMGPGDTIFLPRGVPHAFVQLTETARTVVGYQPAGQMQEFFGATAAWTAPPAKDEVEAVFAAHGMRVVGPPIVRV